MNVEKIIKGKSGLTEGKNLDKVFLNGLHK
jgi:hypothetical protein